MRGSSLGRATLPETLGRAWSWARPPALHGETSGLTRLGRAFQVMGELPKELGGKRQGLGLGFLVGRHGVLRTLCGSGVWQIHTHHGAELLKGTESAGGGDTLESSHFI